MENGMHTMLLTQKYLFNVVTIGVRNVDAENWNIGACGYSLEYLNEIVLVCIYLPSPPLIEQLLFRIGRTTKVVISSQEINDRDS